MAEYPIVGAFKSAWEFWKVEILQTVGFAGFLGAVAMSLIERTTKKDMIRHAIVGPIAAYYFGATPVYFLESMFNAELRSDGSDQLGGFIMGALAIYVGQYVVEFLRAKARFEKNGGVPSLPQYPADAEFSEEYPPPNIEDGIDEGGNDGK